jgi:hypothetical protein
MTFPDRLLGLDLTWDSWCANFPSLPLPDEFALKWTLTRIDNAIRKLPAKSRLSKREQQMLRQWLLDYTEQFKRDQKPPEEGFDVNGGVGVLSGLAGIPAFALAPPVGIGLGAISVFAFARKEYRRHALKSRLRLADQIERALVELERLLR